MSGSGGWFIATIPLPLDVLSWFGDMTMSGSGGWFVATTPLPPDVLSWFGDMTMSGSGGWFVATTPLPPDVLSWFGDMTMSGSGGWFIANTPLPPDVLSPFCFGEGWFPATSFWTPPSIHPPPSEHFVMTPRLILSLFSITGKENSCFSFCPTGKPSSTKAMVSLPELISPWSAFPCLSNSSASATTKLRSSTLFIICGCEGWVSFAPSETPEPPLIKIPVLKSTLFSSPCADAVIAFILLSRNWVSAHLMTLKFCFLIFIQVQAYNVIIIGSGTTYWITKMKIVNAMLESPSQVSMHCSSSFSSRAKVK